MSCRPLLSVLALSCAVALPEDGRYDSFFGPAGKGDGPGAVREGSPAALAILRCANDSSSDELESAKIGAKAAKAILAFRRGDDGQHGTLDDQLLTSLAALDAVDYVGPIALERLLARAESEGFVAYEKWKTGLSWDRNGAAIVDYDLPIGGEKRLREYFAALARSDDPDRAVVIQTDGRDATWGATQKLKLTYCVSDEFGDDKAEVVAATAEAARSWMAAANVRFVYAAEQDASCDPSNQGVVFDIRPAEVGRDEGGYFLARSFYPNMPREERSLLLDSMALNRSEPPSLDGILRHELGHTLGLGHEHMRSAYGECYEGRDFRYLTDYDRASVMHYPQCNGTGDWALNLTELDKQGVALLYGPAAVEDPEPRPEPGVERKQSFAGTLRAGEEQQLGPFVLLPRTSFAASLRGSGDADLYVRWGMRPSETEYDCRPFNDTSREDCAWTVPIGVIEVYVMVKAAAAAAEYTLSVMYRTDVANLLENASFEDGDEETTPPGWTTIQGTFVTRASETAWDGERLGAFLFQPDDQVASIASRCFLLAGAKSLEMSGYARATGNVADSQVTLAVEYFSDRDCSDEIGRLDGVDQNLKVRSQWERLVLRADDVPAGALAARIGVIAVNIAPKPLQLDAMTVVLDAEPEGPSEPSEPSGPSVNPGRWETISKGPPARYGHSAVWTGTEMIIFGGRSETGDEGRRCWAYSPQADAWRQLADAPLIAYQPSAVWASGEMLVFGGESNSTNDTWGYRLDSNQWRQIPTGGDRPTMRHRHSAVWTGSEMIIWGGEPDSASGTGARLNPETGFWTALETSGAPSPRWGHAAVWTGRTMIVWGGSRSNGSVPRDGASFDPTTNHWTPLVGPPEPGTERGTHVMFWTGRELVVWGGSSSSGLRDDGLVYDPRSGSWSALTQGGTIPRGRFLPAGVWTRTEMIIWGGIGTPTSVLFDGARFVPTALNF